MMVMKRWWWWRDEDDYGSDSSSDDNNDFDSSCEVANFEISKFRMIDSYWVDRFR
jgi:hypothetical protein